MLVSFFNLQSQFFMTLFMTSVDKSSFISTASLQPSPSAPSAASGSVSVSRLISHLMVGTPYLLSTILLGLILRDRNRGKST